MKQVWVRSKDGVLGGVCRGIADRFDWDPWLVRIVWILFVAMAGTGVLLYTLLWIALPREDNAGHLYGKRLFKVCQNISRRYGIDVGLVRFLTIALFIPLPVTALVYVVLGVVMQDQPLLPHPGEPIRIDGRSAGV